MCSLLPPAAAGGSRCRARRWLRRRLSRGTACRVSAQPRGRAGPGWAAETRGGRRGSARTSVGFGVLPCSSEASPPCSGSSGGGRNDAAGWAERGGLPTPLPLVCGSVWLTHRWKRPTAPPGSAGGALARGKGHPGLRPGQGPPAVTTPRRGDWLVPGCPDHCQLPPSRPPGPGPGSPSPAQPPVAPLSRVPYRPAGWGMRYHPRGATDAG